ncbi:MAG: Ig-like domain-containing protein [Treponema sp.]|nr:Ig-like domain-containing protein [Treponema sp.]
MMMMLLWILSCDILRDSPFEVSAWSPGEGFFDPAGGISLSLEFSRSPDRASVERYFSLTEDGSRVNGVFRWEGRRMIFYPHAALEENRDYTVTLAAEASDEGGLSMDRRFEGTFTTRGDSFRPRFLSAFPENGAILYGERTELRIVFSRPVPLKSLREHISLNPATEGAWSPEETSGAVRFTPLEPWKQGQRYELRISASLEGENGMSMGKDIITLFTAGDDLTRPFLREAWRLDGEGIMTKLEEDLPPASGVSGIPTENSGWEKGSRIRLEFSEPVDTSTVKSCLTAEPAPSLVLETMPGFHEEIVFRFAEAPAWGSRFTIQIKAGIRDAGGNESREERFFRIYAGGVYSKPPGLIGIRLPMAPGKSGTEDQDPRDYSPENLFYDLPIDSGDDRYPYGEPIPAWIELYFDTAPGADIDVFSVMDLFRIESTNNVFTFSPQSIEGENFSFPDPRPGWESYRRLEIRGKLTNTINAGVVSFCLDPGLGDTLGNQNENPFRISLLK